MRRIADQKKKIAVLLNSSDGVKMPSFLFRFCAAVRILLHDEHPDR